MKNFNLIFIINFSFQFLFSIINLHKRIKFSHEDFFSEHYQICSFFADLVTCTKEILNGKLIFSMQWMKSYTISYQCSQSFKSFPDFYRNYGGVFEIEVNIGRKWVMLLTRPNGLTASYFINFFLFLLKIISESTNFFL